MGRSCRSGPTARRGTRRRRGNFKRELRLSQRASPRTPPDPPETWKRARLRITAVAVRICGRAGPEHATVAGQIRPVAVHKEYLGVTFVDPPTALRGHSAGYPGARERKRGALCLQTRASVVRTREPGIAQRGTGAGPWQKACGPLRPPPKRRRDVQTASKDTSDERLKPV